MSDIPDNWKDRDRTPIDFIVVGAGAGGAPLAARLAERGYTVLVLEMGPEKPPVPPGVRVDPTEVPLLHPISTEDPRHSLRFFVKHFDHDPGGSRDWKKYPGPNDPPPDRRDEEGIFYPRAQGVGGCTIHNAMITIAGPPEDYDDIAEATGDESWRGEQIRRYFQRVEHCHYAVPSLWARIKALFGQGTGWENSRHGFHGWLQVTLADLKFVKRDWRLLRVVLGGVIGAVQSGADNVLELVRATLFGRLFPDLDPNNWETQRQRPAGISRIPVAITPLGQRSSARDRLLAVRAIGSPHRDRLLLETGFCVTRLVLDDDPAGTAPPRARGVSGLRREHAYEADPRASVVNPYPEGDEISLYCRREVLLCGGTFNTPQLLMLSGIGPAEHLREIEQGGIPVKVDRPGVGRNLQDRYEVPLNATVTDRFRSLDGLDLSITQPDSLLKQWIQRPSASAYRRGIYSTNGGLIGLFYRSAQEEQASDLFIFALAAHFAGYYVGYSAPSVQLGRPPGSADRYCRQLTWLILKARTRDRDGYVRLRSAHPLQRPEINFRSFEPMPGGGVDKDLEALHEGAGVVEDILRAGKEDGTIAEYDLPSLDRFGGDRREWIRNTAWGHHACGTCRIGAVDDRRAVVDSRFNVIGVVGLRVVDASIFPRIPGFFIVSNVYTIAEKAADVIAEDHPIPAHELPPESREALNRVPIHPSRSEYMARRVYPATLERTEAELIAARRRAANL